MLIFMLLVNLFILHAYKWHNWIIWIQQHISSLPNLDTEGLIKARVEQNIELALQNLAVMDITLLQTVHLTGIDH